MNKFQDTDTFGNRQRFQITDKRLRFFKAFYGFFKEKEITQAKPETGGDRFQRAEAGGIGTLAEIGQGGLAKPGFFARA